MEWKGSPERTGCSPARQQNISSDADDVCARVRLSARVPTNRSRWTCQPEWHLGTGASFPNMCTSLSPSQIHWGRAAVLQEGKRGWCSLLDVGWESSEGEPQVKLEPITCLFGFFVSHFLHLPNLYCYMISFYLLSSELLPLLFFKNYFNFFPYRQLGTFTTRWGRAQLILGAG